MKHISATFMWLLVVSNLPPIEFGCLKFWMRNWDHAKIKVTNLKSLEKKKSQAKILHRKHTTAMIASNLAREKIIAKQRASTYLKT